MRTRVGHRVVPVLVAAMLVTIAGVLLSPVNATYGDVVQFDIGGLTRPTGITAAADGTMWFVERGTNQIGHLHVDGTFTLTPIGLDTASPWGVVVGPDGAIWFTERVANAVGRYDPETGIVTQIPLSPGASPHGITVAEGALWVAERGLGRIARVDASTHDVTEVDVGGSTSQPFWMATAPDGAVWFTDRTASKIVRYDPASGSLQRHDVSAGSDPRGIAVGPDGTVWFTTWFSGTLGRLDPATGAVSETPIPNTDGVVALRPMGVTVGAGGVWLVLEGADQVLRFKQGTATFDAFPLWAGGQGMAIITGPDGNLWVTEPNGGRIARVQAPDTTPPSISVATPVDHATYVLGEVVAADFSCTDEGGSGLATCVGTVADGDAIDTSTAGPHTFTVDASDTDGNISTATVSYRVEQPPPTDAKPPAIELEVPQDGAAYIVGDRAVARYSCADEGGSGLASCTGPVPDGAVLDTSRPGIFAFTVRAEDGAGNAATVTHTYVVFKDWGGKLALPPVLNDVTAGSAVPVRFDLGDAGASMRPPSTSPTTTPIDCATLEPIGPTVPSAVSPTGERSSSGRVMYVWKTDRAWAGTCRTFTLGAAAPTSLYLRFS